MQKSKTNTTIYMMIYDHFQGTKYYLENKYMACVNTVYQVNCSCKLQFKLFHVTLFLTSLVDRDDMKNRR